MKESFKHQDLIWNAFKEKRRFPAAEIVASQMTPSSKKPDEVPMSKSEYLKSPMKTPQKSGLKITSDETFL